MIFGNRVAKTKLVEQLTLVILQTAHHGSTSPRFASTQRNHASRPVSTDFCNKIGTFQTCRPILKMSVHRGRSEVTSVGQTDANDPTRTSRRAPLATDQLGAGGRCFG